MIKNDILEIMQKRANELAMFSLVFIGILMVFLIPNLVNEVQARIDGGAISFAAPFTITEADMSQGHFTVYPYAGPPGYLMNWQTAGDGLFTGNEEGYIKANVGNLGTVTFNFYNPSIGTNTCSATTTGSVVASCQVGQGNLGFVTFIVTSKSTQGSNNDYCHILTKLGGLEQTKIIRENLHC